MHTANSETSSQPPELDKKTRHSHPHTPNDTTVISFALTSRKWLIALDTAMIDGLLATIPPSVYPRNMGKKVGAALVRMAASHTCKSWSGSTCGGGERGEERRTEMNREKERDEKRRKKYLFR